MPPAFGRMLEEAFETAGHGIASVATGIADEITGRQIPELQIARRDHEQRMHRAASGTRHNAAIVGDDLHRIVDTTGASLGVLAKVLTRPDQSKRLAQLIEKHDFPAFVRSLSSGAQVPPDFFPGWMRRAGGYFPKFAQVLSVRADLIKDREVLEQMGRCIEDMPAMPPASVSKHLVDLGFDSGLCRGVGDSLNAGSIAQVNTVTFPDGRRAVLKVAWPETKWQYQTDFKLFAHAREILRALKLGTEEAAAVAGIFSAVGRNEVNVMREFDLSLEAGALDIVGNLCAPGGEWDSVYAWWLQRQSQELSTISAPPYITMMVQTFAAEQLHSGWRLRVPTPERGHPGCPVTESVFVMSLASGVSMHRLFASEDISVQQTAAKVFLGFAIPFVGWLLLCKSSTCLAHVDPHLGNFRWDESAKTLWVLDWGSHIKLADQQRQALCLLIVLLADPGADDALIADTTRAFGVQSVDDNALAQLMRGMMNATQREAAPEALSAAAMDNVLDNAMSDEVVPVIRCLATLGGILQAMQLKLHGQVQQHIPLSLASLWAPFAERAMAGYA